MINLPKKVKIAGFDICIEIWEVSSARVNDRHGEFSELEGIIRIDTSTNNKYQILDTFLHELNHAIFWAYNIHDKDNEERTVGMFSTAYTQIFRDNVDILRFIQEILSKELKNV